MRGTKRNTRWFTRGTLRGQKGAVARVPRPRPSRARRGDTSSSRTKSLLKRGVCRIGGAFLGAHQLLQKKGGEAGAGARTHTTNHAPQAASGGGSARARARALLPQTHQPSRPKPLYATGTTSLLVMRSYTSRTLRPMIVCSRPVPLLLPGNALFLSICCVISP